MDIALLVVAVLVVAAFVRGGHSGGFSIEQTTTVNGLFVLLVFMSHFENYYEPSKEGLVYPLFQSAHGQLIVVSFFLFSGYGVMSSIIKKGPTYVKGIARTKAPKLLFHFDLCVVLFVLLNIILGIDYGVGRSILAFSTLVDIGNSNWFITTTLITYLIVSTVFTLCKERRMHGVLAVTLLLVLYAAICIVLNVPPRFYNTVLAFPIGMALRESQLIEQVPKIRPALYVFLLVLAAAFSVLPKLAHFNDAQPILFYLAYTVRVASFCVFLTLLLGKFGFNSQPLRFFGQHVFSIYMLQRLAMIPIFQLAILEQYPFARLLFALTITVGMALIMERVFASLDMLFRVFSRK